MNRATFHYKLVRRVHVAVHGTTLPSPEEWSQYLDHIGSRLEQIDGVFSYTQGGGPDTEQRKQAVEFWRRQTKQPPIAVVTPSMLVVRMSGALRWFMPSQIKAFSPRDIDDAHAYLKLDPGQRRSVEQAVQDLTVLASQATAS